MDSVNVDAGVGLKIQKGGGKNGRKRGLVSSLDTLLLYTIRLKARPRRVQCGEWRGESYRALVVCQRLLDRVMAGLKAALLAVNYLPSNN